MANAWGYTGATPSTGTATPTNGTVLAANAQRKYLHITNIGGGIVCLNFGGAAVASQGVMLAGRGTPDCSYEMCLGKGNLQTGSIQAITVAGTATLSFLEGV